MAELIEIVQAELDNISEILAQFPPSAKFNKLSMLELAGVAALLHNFYNGIENVLKQVVRRNGLTMPTGQAWHRDLLNLVINKKIITASTGKALKQYLAFRHFFSHGYALDLDSQRLLPLARSVNKVFKAFEKDIDRCVNRA